MERSARAQGVADVGASWRPATGPVIVPVSRTVRSLCILEALVGRLYPALIIGGPVSLEFTVQPDSTRR